MSAREQFVQAMESLLGLPVCWAQKGPGSYDCSGTVTVCVKKVGGPDLRYTHNAQALHNATPVLTFGQIPLAGDLVFYGADPSHVIHVATYTADGGVISADGATSHLLDPVEAAKNPLNRVRRHQTIKYRPEPAWIHRNTFVDALDRVER